MSRARRLLALVGLAAVSALASAAPWRATEIEMPVHQLGPHSWYVEGRLEEASRENEGFMANAGFVITDEGVVVIDALGSPALADRMLAEIRKRTEQPVKLAIITHYHADHFYGIAALRAAGAKIWADERAKAYLGSEAAERRLAERRALIGPFLGADFRLPLPDRWIDADESFRMGGVKFSLRRLGPAHSPEDLAVLVEPDGVLYSGDVVYAGRVPFIGEANTRDWLRAIDRMLAIPCRVMVPGHGPASTRPHEDAELTRDYLKFLREQMGRAAANLEDFGSAYGKVDWSRFESQPTFDAANRQNAYSVYLEMEQESLGE